MPLIVWATEALVCCCAAGLVTAVGFTCSFLMVRETREDQIMTSGLEMMCQSFKDIW